MLLRCRDLWFYFYVTCCYAAEISGFVATLHVATLQRPLFFCHTVTIDAAWTSCKQFIPTLWVPGTKMSCCMPRCGNGDSLTSTRSCLRKLHRCCERYSEKDACTCPIEIDKKITFYCGENTICPKNIQIWRSKFPTFQVTTMVASLIFSRARFPVRRDV